MATETNDVKRTKDGKVISNKKQLIAKKTKVINKYNKDVDWNGASSLARKAQKANKTDLCLDLLREKGTVKQTELQVLTGWDSNNLHSRFRKKFNDAHGITFNRKEGTFTMAEIEVKEEEKETEPAEA